MERAQSSSTLRLFGIPTEGEDADGYRRVRLAGYSAGGSEIRTAEGPEVLLRSADVIVTGEVEGYTVDGQQVKYFEVPTTAELLEAERRRVVPGDMVPGIGTDLRGGTFASMVARPPAGPIVDMRDLEAMSKDQLLEMFRGGTGDPFVLKYYPTMFQTQSWTYHWLWYSLDPYGGDPDHGY